MFQFEPVGFRVEFNEQSNDTKADGVESIELDRNSLRIVVTGELWAGRVSLSPQLELFEDDVLDHDRVSEEWAAVLEGWETYGDIGIRSVRVTFQVDPEKHAAVHAWLARTGKLRLGT